MYLIIPNETKSTLIKDWFDVCNPFKMYGITLMKFEHKSIHDTGKFIIISYIGFRHVIRAHITCLFLYFLSRRRCKYTTQTGYMSPYYLSKAYIRNLSYCNTMGPYYLCKAQTLEFWTPLFSLIWSLPRLWYGSLSGRISLNHLSIFYNISCYNSLVLLTFVSRSSCRFTIHIRGIRNLSACGVKPK